MASPESRKNLTAIAALIVPVLAVKAVTLVLGQPAAQQASAHPKPAAATTTAPATTAKAAPLTSQQIAAINYIHTLRAQPFGPAPIRSEHAARTTTQPMVQPTEPQVQPSAGLEAVPQFTVTAVMSTTGIVSGSDGSVSVQPARRALINGRPYREGETVKGTSWKIAMIDCDRRSVTLRDVHSDRTVTINVDLPQ